VEVVVGRIGRPHGVRGEVTVEVRTDDPDQRFAAGAVLATDPAARGPLTVAGAGRSGAITILRFEGFADRTAAESLRGTLLLVDGDTLPPPADDEYYDHQLIGLAAVTAAGAGLGEVTDVLHPPASPVLSIRTADGVEVLVPFVAAIVPEVDLSGGRLVIDPPDGMFPEPPPAGPDDQA
jgi:16S rRNA processing protein RimM